MRLLLLLLRLRLRLLLLPAGVVLARVLRQALDEGCLVAMGRHSDFDTEPLEVFGRLF